MKNEKCNSCPRGCNVDRTTNVGRCKSGAAIKVASFRLHEWEEPPISGTRGSGTIFFSGCNLGCKYCQNYSLSHDCYGIDITPYQLAEIMRKLADSGAHNINLVTPSHFATQIIAALDIYHPNLPICYNTSSYDNVATLAMLQGYINIYIADLKYMSDVLSHELSDCLNYPAVACAAIAEMRTQVTDQYDEQGILKSGLILRHLVLPNNIANTRSCLDFIASNIGTDTILSLMSQYTPCGNNLPDYLLAPLKPIEYKLAINYAQKLAFTNCFTQESTSASPDYIPDFEQGLTALTAFLKTL